MITAARAELASFATLPRYAISVTLDLDGAIVYGSQTLTYTNSEPTALPELCFRLYPNVHYVYGLLEVGNVAVNGVPAATHLEEQDTFLRVTLPTPLASNASLTVHLDFTTSIPTHTPSGYGPLVYRDNVLTLAHWHPMLMVHDSAGWHTELGPDYGDFVFSGAAFYTVNVNSPRSVVVVATGVPYQTAVHGADRKSQTFWAGPVRDFYLVASSEYCVASTTVGPTIVNSYYLAGDEERGRQALTVAAQTLDGLNRRVGQYPYLEFDVIESPMRGAAGIEYPGVVAISQAFYRSATTSRDLEFVVSHEVAHQWWYGVVGNNQIMEPWLDEALTNYSVTFYWEAAHSAQDAAYFAQQAFEARYQAAVRERRDMAVNLPVSAYGNGSQYYDMVYAKGALFFDGLRKALGDDTFFRILAEYYRSYRYRIATGQDFLGLATSIGGPVVRQVYNQWVLGTAR